MWFWPLSIDKTFRQQFADARAASTTKFLFLHNFVTLTYIRTVTSFAAQVVLLSGSLLPLLYWLTFKRQRLQHRTAIALVVRITHLLAAMSALSTDWDVSEHAPPLLMFKMMVIGRVFGSLCTALGLQLPFWMDFPLQSCTLAAVMATATPRQCGLPSPALLAYNRTLAALPPPMAAAAAAVLNAETAAAAAVPPSPPTLFSCNQPFFQAMADLLDWPFAGIAVRPGVLELSRLGLCTAVYCWVQLVLCLGLPAMVLWGAERREREAFWRARRRVGRRGSGGQGESVGQGSEGGEAGVAHEGAEGRRAGGDQGVLNPAGKAGEGKNPWLYFAFWAQMSWCVIRTSCQLAL